MTYFALLRTRPGSSSLVVALTLMLSACGGGDPGIDGPTGPQGVSTLMRATAEAAGSNCALGGTRIDAGLDANADGGLSAGETTSTQFVCHGTIGAGGASGLTTLVSMAAESPGVHCAQGGQRISAGPDADRNGVLHASEVDTVSYVCNGAAGNSTNGTDGTDGTNGNNGTNGTNGFNSLIAIVAEPAGVNCAAGGNKMTSGLDLDRNGVLNGAEVTTTRFQCDGMAGAVGAPGAPGSPGAPGASLTWVAAPTDTVAVSNKGYLASGTSRVTVTLPASPAVGDIVRINGVGVGGWAVAQQGNHSIITAGLPSAPMGTQWSPQDPTHDWRAIASSANGVRLAAIDQSDRVFTSTDAGQTWVEQAQGQGFHFGTRIVSSADGNILAALPAGTGELLLSYNAGQSWAPLMHSSAWRAIAMSKDGNQIFAVDDTQQVWASYYGGNVTMLASLPGTTSALACSADCSRMVAANSTGELLTSDQNGAYFNAVNLGVLSPVFHSVTMSADGQRVLAVGNGYVVGTSVFFAGGMLWYTTLPFTSVTSSADGLRVLASTATDLYVSIDGFATWTVRSPPSSNWTAVAMSSDGSRLIAAGGAGVSTSVSTTTPGAPGSLSGSQFSAVELQYVGNDDFAILSSNGVLLAE